MISSASSVINSKGKTLEQSSLLDATKKDATGEELLDFLSLLDQSSSDVLLNLQNNPELQKELLQVKKHQSVSGKVEGDLTKMLTKLQTENNVTELSKADSKKLEALLQSKENINPDILKAMIQGNRKEVISQKVPAAHTQELQLVDFSRSNSSKSSKEAFKQYQKSQDPKIIKTDNHNILDKLQAEPNSFELSSKYNFEGSNNNLMSSVDAQKNTGAEKNTIDTLATQISQRIQEATANRPMMTNSNINIEFHHEELGHMSLNIKKSNRDIEIKIMTGQMDAKNVIHDNRDALIGQLALKGITVNSLSVDSLSSGVANVVDDSKSSQTGKFDSSSQQQSSSQQEQSKHSGQNFTGREKRDELWNILKDQREVMYA